MSPLPRVAFDLTPVISGRTGIARYVTQLGAALARREAGADAPDRPGAGEVELRGFAVGRRSFPVPPGTRHLPVPARVAERWWNVSAWPPIELLVGPVDLVHATGLFMPATHLPLVVTVHDLGALRHPELHPARQVGQQRELIRRLHGAAAILSVSAATADELEAFGVSRERVVVSPLGLTPLSAPVGPPVVESPRGYLLTIGETAPRKDYPVLIEALSRLDHDITLVMVGPIGADEGRIQRRVAELGLGQRVRRLGAVEDAELAGLYRGALALCFPSVTEGFGLPVLEAMAAGTPVVASDIPATRELAGADAIFVGQAVPDAWAQAISELGSSPDLRKRLAEAGPARAAQYTWERTAQATLRAYQLALGTGLATAGP